MMSEIRSKGSKIRYFEFQVEDAASSADSESLDQSSSDLTDTLLFTFVDNKEDLVVVITGIITGGFVCILVLTAVSLTIRKCMGTQITLFGIF